MVSWYHARLDLAHTISSTGGLDLVLVALDCAENWKKNLAGASKEDYLWILGENGY